MKKIILAMLVTAIAHCLLAQSVGIGTNSPQPSSMLDVQSDTSGILIPRMTDTQRNAIANPTTGLLVFVTTDSAFYYYEGNEWVSLDSRTRALTDSDDDTKVQVEETSDEDIIRFDMGGVEYFRMDSGRLEVLNTGRSVYIGEGAGEGDDMDDNVNVGIGYRSSQSNVVGTANTAVGFESLRDNLGFWNTAVGYATLSANTTGLGNTAVGFRSLWLDTTGQFNVGVGYRAMENNTEGSQNVAIGMKALFNDEDANYLVAIGDSALYWNGLGIVDTADAIMNTAVGSKGLFANTAGSSNTAIGFHALHSNTTGSRNTGFGTETLGTNTIGSSNTACGSSALHANTTGTANTAIGTGALSSVVDRSYLVAIGDSALYNNGLNVAIPIEATLNTAIGSKTMYSNTTGFANTAVGYHALLNNTTGWSNTVSGSEALYSNTEGYENTCVGYRAMRNNTTGYRNTAIGMNALYENTTGLANTAAGYYALFKNTTGFNNSATGFNALFDNTTGNNNSAFGRNSLESNTTGNNNTAIGWGVLSNNTIASDNTGCGALALYNNTTGANNIAIGRNALYANTTGYANTAVGSYAFSEGQIWLNSTAIGYDAEPLDSNTVRIGNASVTSIGGYSNWSNLSDGRFKKDVQENVVGLDFILKLRPVTFFLDMDAIAHFHNTPDSLRLPQSENRKGAELQSGFIAQEVEATAQAAGYDFHGVDKPRNTLRPYGLRYAEFTVPLVKAVQEQQAMIDELKQDNALLHQRLDTMAEEMAHLIVELQVVKEEMSR